MGLGGWLAGVCTEIDGWIHGWMDGWMDGWMGGMDGWMEFRAAVCRMPLPCARISVKIIVSQMITCRLHYTNHISTNNQQTWNHRE